MPLLGSTGGALSFTALPPEGIASDAVETAKINNLAVTTDKINALAVTTAKLAVGSVTKAKQESITVTTNGSDPGEGGVSKSSLSGNINATNTSFQTTVTTALTTTGRPVFIYLENGTAGTAHNIGITAGFATIEIRRDSSVLLDHVFVIGNGDQLGILGNSIIDTPSAGTYDYSMNHKTDGAGTLNILDIRIVAFEL